MPGTASLNAGGVAGVNAVSCATAGNCSAGGFYHDIGYAAHVFVVTQTNGTWGTAEEVPGTASLNAGGQAATINSASCAAANRCSAGARYLDGASHFQASVVTES